jgi:hypothetical protein
MSVTVTVLQFGVRHPAIGVLITYNPETRDCALSRAHYHSTYTLLLHLLLGKERVVSTQNDLGNMMLERKFDLPEAEGKFVVSYNDRFY